MLETNILAIELRPLNPRAQGLEPRSLSLATRVFKTRLLPIRVNPQRREQDSNLWYDNLYYVLAGHRLKPTQPSLQKMRGPTPAGRAFALEFPDFWFSLVCTGGGTSMSTFYSSPVGTFNAPAHAIGFKVFLLIDFNDHHSHPTDLFHSPKPCPCH